MNTHMLKMQLQNVNHAIYKTVKSNEKFKALVLLAVYMQILKDLRISDQVAIKVNTIIAVEAHCRQKLII